MKIVWRVTHPPNSTESHPTVLKILQSRPRRGAGGKILRVEAATLIQFAYIYFFDTDVFIRCESFTVNNDENKKCISSRATLQSEMFNQK